MTETLLRRPRHAAGRVTCVAVIVASLFVGTRIRGATRETTDGQAVDTQLHEFELVVPNAPTGESQPTLRVDVTGQPPQTIDSSRRLLATLVRGRAEVKIRYESGLELVTVVGPGDHRLALPGLFTSDVAVQDSYALPVRDATIDASGLSGKFKWTATVRTNLLGVAHVPRPSAIAGPAVLVTQAPGYQVRKEEVSLTRTGARFDATVSLAASSTITGALSPTSVPIVTCVLRLWNVSDGGRRHVTQTSARSRFTFSELVTGEYELDVIVPRAGVLEIKSIVVREGQTYDVGDIDLSPNASLSATVVDRENQPLAGVRVRLSHFGVGADLAPEATTNARGEFQIPRLLRSDYDVELYLPNLGWQIFPQSAIPASEDPLARRVLRFTGSGCALNVAVDTNPQHPRLGYSLLLPVSDSPLSETADGESNRLSIGSVPCVGSASARVSNDDMMYSVPLAPGTATLLIPVDNRQYRDVRLLVGQRPFVGAAIWAVPMASNEVVNRARSFNVTNGDGRATVPMSNDEHMIVYLQQAAVSYVVHDVSFPTRSGSLELRLPERSLTGMVRDIRGNGVAGAYISGEVVADDKFPVPATVRSFKGFANSDGTFEIVGISPGGWRLVFNHDSESGRSSYSGVIEIGEQQSGAVAVAATLR